MDLSIAAILAQDGITTGAIYALLALALVLVFSVTRVIFIPQGEFVSYGALTLAMLQANKAPPTALLLIALGVACFVVETIGVVRRPERRRHWPRTLALSAGRYLLFPLAVYALTAHLAALALPMIVQVTLTLAIIVPMGPFIYRLAYEPIAEATTLLLLIVAVAVHFAMVGLGLLMFGAEGSRTTPFSDASFSVGTLLVAAQSLWVVVTALVLIVALYVYFDRSISGKALRATSINRLGARLVGIGTAQAGRLAFTLAAGLGALSGVLVAPLTTIYYDSGFLIGLKGFVGAIIGGLVSYPLAAAGSLLVGLLESYSSFWASAYKEIIVFTLIIPVLLWLSVTRPRVEEEEEE
ncbi:amino acid/amide ABC transporter membrane protein 1 (HAAT family) [Trinickia symbiotica]|uniref:Branched-chain amino acid ABC transporter permease n=1 Tax=Trinickia symbiotica TaxID=863227 RepID=A0A2N7X741_9BURK|nr:branched-chain amino acid ABC transporter permease [Trinickia symbiotica]PMS37586.1 branched-chain amino acid ABC transporter permease [Trinickia symbiotica]PPK43996.1 amino acid/amide ABC transporter membrane protein 1 (HAAT family) [Trinickia symbiotica]